MFTTNRCISPLNPQDHPTSITNETIAPSKQLTSRNTVLFHSNSTATLLAKLINFSASVRPSLYPKKCHILAKSFKGKKPIWISKQLCKLLARHSREPRNLFLTPLIQIARILVILISLLMRPEFKSHFCQSR